MQDLQLNDFPLTSYDKLRYADTDRQGHVNNAVFSTFLETGRVEFIYRADFPPLEEGASFVIAALELKFLNEVKWPGKVDIGTGILRIGNSSLKLYQKIFQDGTPVGSSESVIVQVKDGKGYPFSEEAKTVLGQWLMPTEKG